MSVKWRRSFDRRVVNAATRVHRVAGGQPAANLEERVMALRSACVPFAKYSVTTLNIVDLESSVMRCAVSHGFARTYARIR